MVTLLPLLWAGLLAMAVASILTRLYGQSPLEVYRLLLAGTWGSTYGIGQVLFKTTPLLCTGLAVALGVVLVAALVTGCFACVFPAMYPPEPKLREI